MRGEPLELAPARDSGNATVFGQYVDLGFLVANSVLLLLTSVGGMASNVFVILAVYNQKSLQTSINALVVNLAVIDFLRCAVDCPVLLAIVVLVHRQGHADQAVCNAQVASFSLSCCVQMLTLACISAERYQAIAQPFKNAQRRKRITILIPLTWTLAIAVAGCCLLFFKDSPVHVTCKGSRRDASESYDTFGLYMLLPLWAVCFGVIIGFYTSIFALVRSHNRRIFDKGTFPFSKKGQSKAEEVTVVESGNCDKSQTSPSTEPSTRAEEGPSKKDSAAAPSTPVKTTAEKKAASTVEITDLESERSERAQPAERTLKTEQSNPRDTGAEPSNGGIASSVRSSAPPQKVSSKINTQIQSTEKVKSDAAAGEATGTGPRPPLPPPTTATTSSEDPESASVLLIKSKQAKNREGEGGGGNGRGGDPPAVKEDQPPLSLVPVSGKAAPTETAPTETAPTETAPTEAAKDDLEVDGAVCMMPPRASKERANKKKESKMAKRAGYIIVTFLLFWLPLITTIVLNFVIHKNKNTQGATIQQVEVLSVCVSCITSLSDPIIYAAVNPQFRTEFDRIRNKVKSAFTFDWKKTE